MSGATSRLDSKATIVVLLREGTRTVLSMQNNYRGPPGDFAMVVPVPVVLQKENVRALPRKVFEKIDQLSAPRLVEYWEQDPCPRHRPEYPDLEMAAAMRDVRPSSIKIEAQFTVAEYDIVVLSADDSTSLEGWLLSNHYKIPPGAAPLLHPYVQAGMKFFVARVDASKVQREGARTMLSPLRFHYDSEKFELPVRLGRINSPGTQDLLIHILAQGKRYEVANHSNVTIPTNLDVGEQTRDQFGNFYAALFDETLRRHPGAAVTEYAWDTGTCDPCPVPPLDVSELATLGLDTLGAAAQKKILRGMELGWQTREPQVVLTRLHVRLDARSSSADLVFREARPISGGLEQEAPDGGLSYGAELASSNHFQARYAIRHPWGLPVLCKEPRARRWGPPRQEILQRGVNRVSLPSSQLLFEPAPVALPPFLLHSVPELGLTGEAPLPSPVLEAPSEAPPIQNCPTPVEPIPAPLPPAPLPPPRGCAGCALPPKMTGSPGVLWLTAALSYGLLHRRRSRRISDGSRENCKPSRAARSRLRLP